MKKNVKLLAMNEQLEKKVTQLSRCLIEEEHAASKLRDDLD